MTEAETYFTCVLPPYQLTSSQTHYWKQGLKFSRSIFRFIELKLEHNPDTIHENMLVLVISNRINKNKEMKNLTDFLVARSRSWDIAKLTKK